MDPSGFARFIAGAWPGYHIRNARDRRCPLIPQQSALDLPRHRLPRQLGFSLVELSVVLVILAVIIGFGLSAIGAVRTGSAVTTTVRKQEAIKAALIAYVRNHKRLPCPDRDFASPDGVENRVATTGSPPVPDVTRACSGDAGLIPYVTLGLAQEAALDGFENLFTYFVSNNVRPAAEPNKDWTITSNPATAVRGMTAGNVGNIQLAGEGGQALTSLAVPETLGVVVILSHGPNGLGARTTKGTVNAGPLSGTDEADNAAGAATTTLHQRTPTDNASVTGGAFDDITMVLRAADILGPLFAEGTMKPAIAQTLENLNAIRELAASIAVQTCSAPSMATLIGTLSQAPFVDGWGNLVNYASGGTMTGAASTATMFTLNTTNPVGGAVIGPSGNPSGVVPKGAYPLVMTNCP